MMINTIVSEILEIVLLFILGFTYYYLTILLLIFIISPIIILIATLSISMPNKNKIFILILNTIYSFIISLFSIFSLIYVIIVIISIIMIIFYIFNITYIFKEYYIKNKLKLLIEAALSFTSGLFIIMILLTTNSESYIQLLFLFILLIAAILSYILQFNQKNIKNIY